MRQLCVVVACALTLVGCQTDSAGPTLSGAPAGTAPTNYRLLAANYVKASFKDPYTVRDAEIAAPIPGRGPSLNEDGFTTPWLVCLKANAKNAMGAYTGRKITALAVSNDRVVNVWDEGHFSGATCEGAVYQPFPEIEEKKSR